MRKIDLVEQKNILKEILASFHAFCQKKELTYYLTGGTLLGAVRHKGFIPWDDDIDVCMPRADYEIMLDSFNGTNNHLRVISARDKEYYLPFAKIVDTETYMEEAVDSDFKLGVYIDVFPIDNMSDDYDTAYSLYRDVTKYRNALTLKNIKISNQRALYKNIVIGIGKIALCLIPRAYIIGKIDEHSKRYDKASTSYYVGMVCSAFYGEREILKGEWFSGRCLLDFEGNKYWAPKGYDAFLTQLYGDYMQLPPVEKRVTHHDNTAWMMEY